MYSLTNLLYNPGLHQITGRGDNVAYKMAELLPGLDHNEVQNPQTSTSTKEGLTTDQLANQPVLSYIVRILQNEGFKQRGTLGLLSILNRIELIRLSHLRNRFTVAHFIIKSISVLATTSGFKSDSN